MLPSLLLPVFVFIIGQRNPQAQTELDIVTTISSSLVERFGLFSIIVLGKIIVGVVNGVAEHRHLNWTIGITALLSTLIAIALRRVYFDSVFHHLPRPSTAMVSAWFYYHLPLTIGNAAVGVAVFNVIEHAGKHLPLEADGPLVLAIAVTLVSIAVLARIIPLNHIQQQTYRIGGRFFGGGSVIDFPIRIFQSRCHFPVSWIDHPNAGPNFHSPLGVAKVAQSRSLRPAN